MIKKIVYTSFFAVIGFIFLQSYKPVKVAKKDGAEPGYTGSPGDTFKNCTACHLGKATPVLNWITSDIPSTGYIPGQTYNITATNTESEGTRFGFQVSPQNMSGTMLGKLILSDNVQTKLVGSGKYITYTENGVDGVGSKSWNFKWEAPAIGTGDVTFYGGFNSNFNGHKDGDQTFLSTLTVKEDPSSSISDLSASTGFTTYPNPSKDLIFIKFELKNAADILLEIVDASGKQVAVILNNKQSGKMLKQFNTSALANGNYFVRLQSNGKSASKQITVNH